MTISFVQKAVNFSSASASSISVSCSSTGAGNLICGFVTAGITGATLTVKDSNSVTYTIANNVNDTGNGNQAWTFYLPNGAGGATSLTATFNNPFSFIGIEMQEWSGVATTTPLDGSSIENLASSTTPTQVTGITTTANGDLIYAACVPDSGNAGTISAGSGFTIRNSSAGDIADESQIQSTAGNIKGSFGFTTTQACQLGIMAFKAAAAAATNPFIQSDWPNPQRPVWYQHWQNTPQQSRPVTFNNFDWPLPQTYPRPDEYYSFSNVQFVSQQPASYFHNYDFPNPYPVIWYRSWEFNNVQFISRQPASFFRNYDFPNPQPITWYQWWSQSPAVPPPQKPFLQSDWPLPYPVQWYKDYSFNNIEVISNQPASMFRNNDWPNPYPVYWYRDYNQNVVITIPVSAPFVQTDWPNPQPLTWYRDYNQNLVLYLPTSAQPFNQFDWPVPKTPQPIDQFWFQALALNLPPPPPPPPPPPASGRTWTKEQWTQQLMEYVKARQPKLLTFSEMGKMGGRPRKS